MSKARDLSQVGSVAAQGLSFRNRLINGSMQVWQRGTSFSATPGVYLADRWRSNQTFAAAQSTDVPSGTSARYSLQATMTSGQYGTIQQRIESINCNDLVGQSVTISFWAKVSTGSTSIYVGLEHANSQDNFSATTSMGSTQNVPIGSSWAKYSVTFNNLPSGATNGIQLQWYSDGSACTYRMTNVQLEVGTGSTPFENRPYGTELALCQRYCPVMSAVAPTGSPCFGVGNIYNSSNINISGAFQTVTRVPPSGVTVTSPTNFGINTGGANYSVTSIGLNSASVNSYMLVVAVSGSPSGTCLLLNGSGSGQIVFTGCEL